MGLRFSYTLLAPLYDLMVARATHPMRKASLDKIHFSERQQVLLCGVGSGLDLPLLPHGPDYTGIDLTPAMLRRAEKRQPSGARSITLQQGDVMQLPYGHSQFDIVIMHLILAVVPEPQRALEEAARVLKEGGHILILDKFLHPGERAPFRRLLNPLLRRVATRTDVVFEELLIRCPQLQTIEDLPAGMGGWFRHIILHKPALQK